MSLFILDVLNSTIGLEFVFINMFTQNFSPGNSRSPNSSQIIQEGNALPRAEKIFNQYIFN